MEKVDVAIQSFKKPESMIYTLLSLKNIKFKAILPFLLILGFVIIFPAFNFFKTHTINELSQFKFTIGDTLNTVDFDAYQLFLETSKYVSSNGVSFW